jgi:hypothetical protein
MQANTQRYFIHGRPKEVHAHIDNQKTGMNPDADVPASTHRQTRWRTIINLPIARIYTHASMNTSMLSDTSVLEHVQVQTPDSTRSSWNTYRHPTALALHGTSTQIPDTCRHTTHADTRQVRGDTHSSKKKPAKKF